MFSVSWLRCQLSLLLKIQGETSCGRDVGAMYRLVLGLLAVTLVTATPRVRRQAAGPSPGGSISPSCIQLAFDPQPDVVALQDCLLQGTLCVCVCVLSLIHISEPTRQS